MDANQAVEAKRVDWLRTKEAAVRLKRSERSILDLAKRGKLKSKREVDAQSNQLVVKLHAGDVERMAYDLEHPSARAVQAPQSRALLAPSAAPQLRQWLTVDEDAEYTGLPVSCLRSLIQAGDLLHLDVGPRAGGRYRVKRADLDSIAGKAGGLA